MTKLNRMGPLRAYSAAELALLTPKQLIERMIGDEDRVPRTVIDECAQRGDEMVRALQRLPGEKRFWRGDAATGEWWLPLHAVHILGLIASEPAGLLLARYLCRVAEAGDENLRDWLAGRWPALIRNKPESALKAMRELALDRALDLHARREGAECVLAAAHARGTAAFESALDWLAGIAADESEELMVRAMLGVTLLNFPRERNRPLLEALAALQTGQYRVFSKRDLRQALARRTDDPQWVRFGNPWEFYSPAQIQRRQERWLEEEAGLELAARGEVDSGGEPAQPEEPRPPYVRPIAKVGRNDPCPCGSGKKYKHCCLNAPAADAAPASADGPVDPLRSRLNRLNESFVPKMLNFTVEVFGKQALLEAWDAFTLGNKTPFDPKSPLLQLFMPWFFHDWTPEKTGTRAGRNAPRGESPVRAWLNRKGTRLDPLERRYFEACLEAPFSFHETLEVRPGSGLRLRDILTGEEREVTERSGSRTAKPGDIMFAKVVPIEHLALIDGCAHVMIPPIEKAPIIELRRRIRERGSALTPALLREYDLEIFGLYHLIAARLLNPRMPELRNTDGEVLSFHKIRYDIDSPQAAFDALKGLALDATEDELLVQAERDAEGALRKVEFGWLKRGNAQHAHWNNTVLGNIEIDGKSLTVEVNSRRRAGEFRALAESLLGERARYRTTVVESAKATPERARTKSDPAADEKRRLEQDELKARPEVQAALAQAIESHFTSWPETKLPVLGGRTPLEAMQDADGREMVEALVVQFARGLPSQLPAGHEAIVARLRERLGLGGKA